MTSLGRTYFAYKDSAFAANAKKIRPLFDYLAQSPLIILFIEQQNESPTASNPVQRALLVEEISQIFSNSFKSLALFCIWTDLKDFCPEWGTRLEGVE